MTVRPGAAAGAGSRTVLLVEDELDLAGVIRDYLVTAGYVVESTADGFSALHLASTTDPDLIILDRMIPGLDGAEVCRRIRESSVVPIILLTALGTEEDRILGLEHGADDYITKPFSPRELVLRVGSVLRRSVGEFTPESTVTVGPFHLNPASHVATRDGEALNLTGREYDLLAFLLRRPNQVFSREELMRGVWGWDFGDSSTVTVHVRRLREKIEDLPTSPRFLQTVWGVGYRFDASADGDPR